MSDTITQQRLSMRLDILCERLYRKESQKATLDSAEWNKIWRVADVARIENTLTPEIVDDVRVVLHTL